MTAIYLVPRLARVLRDAGITSREELIARADELEALGLAPRDAAMIRRKLGIAPPPQAGVDDARPSDGLRPSDGARPAADLLDPDPTANLPEILTTTEAAAFLRVGRRAVTTWCASGKIAAYRLGTDWRIPRSEIRRLLIPDAGEDQPSDPSAIAPE